ncbi:MAG: hypothetical protein EOP38_09335 [Rubrivivax sp.]|nr:MAG: hypothetical protein EOP38_09335 [Rubrivivax sp.]
MSRSPLPAELRLAQSRERIRQWLTQGQEGQLEDEGDAEGLDLPRQIKAWLGSLRDHPILTSTADAVQGWWESHPWRPATHLASGLVNEALHPLARKHPIALVLIAMTLGGSLVWLKPGRGLIKSLVLKGVVSQSVLGLAKQPFVGSLANHVITWMHKLSTPAPRPQT